MRGAVGGSLGSTPVVCGGDFGDKCYAYIKNSSSIDTGNTGNKSEYNAKSIFVSINSIE